MRNLKRFFGVFHVPFAGQKSKSNSGFSLVELMTVVTIIGVLANIGAIEYLHFKIRAERAGAKQYGLATLKFLGAYHGEFGKHVFDGQSFNIIKKLGAGCDWTGGVPPFMPKTPDSECARAKFTIQYTDLAGFASNQGEQVRATNTTYGACGVAFSETLTFQNCSDYCLAKDSIKNNCTSATYENPVGDATPHYSEVTGGAVDGNNDCFGYTPPACMY